MALRRPAPRGGRPRRSPPATSASAHTVRNALKLCEVAGRDDVPVFAGCAGAAAASGARTRRTCMAAMASAIPATRPPRAARKPNTRRWRSCGCRTSMPGSLLLVALGAADQCRAGAEAGPDAAATRRAPGGDGRRGHRPRQHHAVGRVQHRLRSGSRAHRVRRLPAHRPVRLGSDDRATAWPTRDIDALGGGRCAARAVLRGDLAHTRALGRADGRGERWHSADALAMAWALAPGRRDSDSRNARWRGPGAAPARGATAVDWDRAAAARPTTRAILLRLRPGRGSRRRGARRRSAAG